MLLPLHQQLGPLGCKRLPGGASSPLLTSLRHWWSMEETSGSRADSVGGNTLTGVGSPGYAAGVSGATGNAATLTVAAGQQLNPASEVVLADDAPWAISMWVRFDAINTINGLHGQTAATSRSFQLLGTTWYWYSQAGTLLTWSQTISAATWYHLALICDGTNSSNVRLYVNNVDKGAQTCANSSYRIGSLGNLDPSGAVFPLDGRIDATGIWDRVLSAAEVSQLYASGAGLQHPFS
jgi:hypothetical protein